MIIKSYSEKMVLAFFGSHGLPEPEFEYRFDPIRKWRFDIAWPFNKNLTRSYKGLGGYYGLLAIEVQGGLFVHGRHNQGAALVKEHEKLNRAACLGWRVLYVQPRDLYTAGTALMVKECFGWL